MKKSSKSPKKSQFRPRRTEFWEEFAAELDIFDSTMAIPSWAFDYRDDLIRKIGPELKKICRKLKSIGLNFKIKWPVEIDGKWKFADVFFRDRFRIVEVETLTELERKMSIKVQTAD